MTELLRFASASGPVIVEVDADDPGFARVARSGLIGDARHGFEASLRGVHDAAQSALSVFRDGTLRPDTVQIEFGVRLTAEAGAVIARTALDAHLTVRLSWSTESASAPSERPT